MKNPFQKFRERYRHLNMRRKIFISYTIPMLAICMVVEIFGAALIEKHETERLHTSLSQNLTQADSFISTYLQAMELIGLQIRENADLNSILQDPDFESTSEDPLTGYREYLQLVPIFSLIELQNGDFRIGMYVSDEVSYANNGYYFYPVSDLTGRDDYDSIMETLGKGINAYCLMESKETSDANSRTMYLTQLSMMTVTDTEGQKKQYIFQVQTKLSLLEKILTNARLTKGSSVYLFNREGAVLAASEGSQLDALTEDQLKSMRTAQNKTTVSVGGNDYGIFRQRLTRNNWQLIMLVSMAEYTLQRDELALLNILMGIIIIVVSAFTSGRLARFYKNKIDVLNNSMNKVRNGQINVRVQEPGSENGPVDEMDLLYRNFDFMIARIQTLMKEEYKLGRNITRAELRALQAQINPHFLYNTLDLINWGAMDYGADSVAKLARDLGQFYRLTLNHGKSAILIGDEVRHVESYIAIENAHFEDAIELVTEIPEEIASLACLNITLQPFVENSIVHGMAEHPEITTCRIVIRAVREGEDIVFTVSDDGPGIDPKIAESITHAEVPGASTTGYGVSNICFRLKLCYGDAYGVRYLPAGEEGGCTVRIRIRALTMEELEKLLEEE